MNFSSLFSVRIAEERKRLGFSQAKAADLCGVSREMWGKYERAKATASSEVLSYFSFHGADAQFILTGKRAEWAVNPTELFLLEHFRNASDELKQAALSVLTGGQESKYSNVFHGNVGQVAKFESGSAASFEFFSDKKSK